MSTKCISSWMAVLFLVAGCAMDSERAIKMERSSGKMNRGSPTGYHAVCKTQTPGGHEGAWAGPLWPEKETAMRDAADHNKKFPGHNATVEH